MSLIKKIASVFGKKDEPKKKEAQKQHKPTSSKKKTKPHQEEWRPGSGPKKKDQPKGKNKPRGQSQPRQKKSDKDPFALTEEEKARMKEFRPEEEDRRLAYERRLRKRKEDRLRQEQGAPASFGTCAQTTPARRTQIPPASGTHPAS